MRSTRKNYEMSNRNQHIHYGLIIIVCFFAFFINNQVVPADIMEARNLATAQEMVREGNYLVPTMNDELRLEKPPLPTWIAAGIEHITPGNLVVQRYATGLVATLMIIFLYLLVSRIARNRTIGLISALILATCYNVVFMGRTATWDIYCHSFMLGAIYFLILAFEKEGKQWLHFILSGAFMGLSFLGKGPVSFYALLLPFIISYGIIYRPRLKGKILPLLTMVVICLAISSWWTLYILIFHKDIALSVAQKESSSWLNHNVRPWYYYWGFAAETGIWSLFLLTSIIYFFVKKKYSHKYRKEYAFSVFWLLASLVLLSIIPEKKTRYLLPISIPGSIVIAFYIYQSIKDISSKSEKVIFRLNAIVIALILIAIPVAIYMFFFREDMITLPIFICITIFSWALGIYIIRCCFNPIKVAGIFAAIILTMVMVEALCLIPIGQVFINQDRHSIRLLRQNQKVQGLPFYHNQDEDLRIELVYEANQTIKPINTADSIAIQKNKPFVFVSEAPIENVFANQNVTIEHIDIFDNNWRQSDHKRYNPNLVRRVAIIR